MGRWENLADGNLELGEWVHSSVFNNINVQVLDWTGLESTDSGLD